MNRKVAACARAHVCIWPVKWLPKQQPKQGQKRCPLRKNNLTMKKQNIDFILNEGNTGQSHCQNTVSRKEESRRAPDLAEAKSLSSVWKKKKNVIKKNMEKNCLQSLQRKDYLKCRSHNIIFIIQLRRDALSETLGCARIDCAHRYLLIKCICGLKLWWNLSKEMLH